MSKNESDKPGKISGQIIANDSSHLKVPSISKKGTQHLKPPPEPPAKPPKS